MFIFSLRPRRAQSDTCSFFSFSKLTGLPPWAFPQFNSFCVVESKIKTARPPRLCPGVVNLRNQVTISCRATIDLIVRFEFNLVVCWTQLQLASTSRVVKLELGRGTSTTKSSTPSIPTLIALIGLGKVVYLCVGIVSEKSAHFSLV